MTFTRKWNPKFAEVLEMSSMEEARTNPWWFIHYTEEAYESLCDFFAEAASLGLSYQSFPRTATIEGGRQEMICNRNPFSTAETVHCILHDVLDPLEARKLGRAPRAPSWYTIAKNDRRRIDVMLEKVKDAESAGSWMFR